MEKLPAIPEILLSLDVFLPSEGATNPLLFLLAFISILTQCSMGLPMGLINCMNFSPYDMHEKETRVLVS